MHLKASRVHKNIAILHEKSHDDFDTNLKALGIYGPHSPQIRKNMYTSLLIGSAREVIISGKKLPHYLYEEHPDYGESVVKSIIKKTLESF